MRSFPLWDMRSFSYRQAAAARRLRCGAARRPRRRRRERGVPLRAARRAPCLPSATFELCMACNGSELHRRCEWRDRQAWCARSPPRTGRRAFQCGGIFRNASAVYAAGLPLGPPQSSLKIIHGWESGSSKRRGSSLVQCHAAHAGGASGRLCGVICAFSDCSPTHAERLAWSALHLDGAVGRRASRKATTTRRQAFAPTTRRQASAPARALGDKRSLLRGHWPCPSLSPLSSPLFQIATGGARELRVRPDYHSCRRLHQPVS